MRHGRGKGTARKILRWIQLGGGWGEPSQGGCGGPEAQLREGVVWSGLSRDWLGTSPQQHSCVSQMYRHPGSSPSLACIHRHDTCSSSTCCWFQGLESSGFGPLFSSTSLLFPMSPYPPCAPQQGRDLAQGAPTRMCPG